MLTTVMQTFTEFHGCAGRALSRPQVCPISTASDYYALQAVFAGVDPANRIYDGGHAAELAYQRRADRC
jgi:hypothetical protein